MFNKDDVMKKRIYEIIEVSKEDDITSHIYDLVMMFTIFMSIIPLATVGYGDIYPITTLGRIITMVSSFMGIAIVALPAGIITAGYMKKIESDKT